MSIALLGIILVQSFWIKTTLDNKEEQFSLNINQAQKFHLLLIGAFRVPQNAKNLVFNLKEKGYNASLLSLNEKGLSPVAFNSFLNREEAVSELRLIQKKENKDAWIFEGR